MDKTLKLPHLIWLRPSLALVLSVSANMAGHAQVPGTRDLTEASLEDLMNIQVTSVSKKQQKLSKAGTAIYVVNQEDIRRSGATNIPDLLRMVPGVDVAQIRRELGSAGCAAGGHRAH